MITIKTAGILLIYCILFKSADVGTLINDFKNDIKLIDCKDKDQLPVIIIMVRK